MNGTGYSHIQCKNAVLFWHFSQTAKMSVDEVNPWSDRSLYASSDYPLYFRPVSSFFPASKEVEKKCKIPFGIIISPGMVGTPPIADYSESNIIRCPKCSAYLSPYSKVSEGSNEWECAICGYKSLYFKNENLSEKIETRSPVVDIYVPKYITFKASSRPSFLFIFDISYNSIRSGFTKAAAKSVYDSLDQLSDDVYISLITVENNITIFDLKKNRRFVFSELENVVFCTNVCKMDFAKGLFKKILEEIMGLDYRNSKKEHCFGNALEAASNILSKTGGIVMSFIYGPPKIGPYKIPNRCKDEMLSESKLLKMNQTDQSVFYRNISRVFSSKSISHYLFIACDDFVDIAILGVPSGLTGGKCKLYKNFNELHYSQLFCDVYQILSSNYFWNAYLKMRVSGGYTLSRTHCNCSHIEHGMVRLSSFSSSDSILFEFDTELHVTQQNAIFQFALLWTNDKHIQMLRIMTFSIPVSNNPDEIISNLDEGVLATILAKRSIIRMLKIGIEQAVSSFIEETKNVISNSRVKFIPKLTYGFLRSNFLSINYPTGADGRFSQIISMRSIGIIDLLLYMYPRLLTIDGKVLPLVLSSINNNNILILHSNEVIIIWGKTEQILNEIIDNNNLTYDYNINLSQIKSSEICNLIQDCWKLNYHYIPITKLFGNSSLKQYMIGESEINSSFSLSNW